MSSNKKKVESLTTLSQKIRELTFKKTREDLKRYSWGWNWTVSGNDPIGEMKYQIRHIFKPTKWDQNKGEFIGGNNPKFNRVGQWVPDKYTLFAKLYLIYKRFLPLIFTTQHKWENNHGKIDGNRHDNYSWSLISPFKIYLNSYRYSGPGCFGEGEFTKTGQYSEKYIWQKKYKITCCYADDNGEDDYFYWIPNAEELPYE